MRRSPAAARARFRALGSLLIGILLGLAIASALARRSSPPRRQPDATVDREALRGPGSPPAEPKHAPGEVDASAR